ncbi:HxxPF-repeated domain-containing protein, partial [Kibdelosporangium sp. 4NS15]|nr:HxxPF-repeated domain-containing protein [Kibdelosporangium persicum]
MPRPDVVPLSFAQRRLWFINKMDEGSAVYNMPMALRMSGPLDRDALRAALADVVARHEALRTIFPEIDGEPHQVVLPATQGPVWTEREMAEDDLGAAIAEQATYSFDLGKDLPIRASLFRLSDNEHVLMLVMHHIAGDGWSMAPLTENLAEAYAARREGHAPSWQPLRVQYVDYTLWQRDLLGDESDPDSLYSRQIGYWRNELAGAPELLNLPTDRPRPAVASFRGARIHFTFDATRHQAMHALARECGGTVFMVLQASLASLLSRLGAGVDIPLGSGVAGRTDSGLDDVVGFFVNTIVVRVDVSGDPSFVDVVGRVRERSLGAFANQDVPFEH